MGEYAIKIKSKTNLNEQLPNLNPKNFVVKNAFVNKVKKWWWICFNTRSF
ncbi:hypothetical protein FFR91_00285 [Mycoplasma mycoides subsp. mycoides]|uniref:Uncharacterized protein n=1 Tax=Mycoplasma mycoides subsp. mycoides SC (strain CCUG 32753 / NCTC 10114 / PG1) TaxID=272632 RepID=Q6MUH2_MYCMS|nr:hypothetical protein FFR90_00285 [Mycoplasma mycoides subsp. mycoides]TNJ31809.1 hypothetical protein FFR91_00285 [Mycoplasma mycoides subsp. mycoides]BCU84476.1 hypothetical protein mmcaprivi_08550 [Mycoplasma mycoides]CAE76712.1 Hypothetical protein MSC_0059 [Mycoplasma mycoides subsp. mycoides SC str. PG1]